MSDANNAIFFYYRYIKRKQTKHKECSTMNNQTMTNHLITHYEHGAYRRAAEAAAYRRANTNESGKSGLSNGHKLAIVLGSVMFAVILIAQLVAV